MGEVVADTVAGSDDGMGIALPLILGLVLLAAVVTLALRLRRGRAAR